MSFEADDSENNQNDQVEPEPPLSPREKNLLLMSLASRMDQWMAAPSPNYQLNQDHFYPYSELPFLGGFRVLKLQFSRMDIVEFWGEGRIASPRDQLRGFQTAYNVNEQFQLVSCGPDMGLCIPNRIPTLSFDHPDISSYVSDGTVFNVMFKGESMSYATAKEITRIIHPEGQVVLYDMTKANARVLSDALAKKRMHPLVDQDLPKPFDQLSEKTNIQISHLSRDKLVQIMCDLLEVGFYARVHEMLKDLSSSPQSVTHDIMQALAKRAFSASQFVSFANYLNTMHGARYLIYFPKSIAADLLSAKVLTYRNMHKKAVLVLEESVRQSGRMAYADQETTGLRATWEVEFHQKIGPNVYFKLINAEFKTTLSVYHDVIMDETQRMAYGGIGSNAQLGWCFKYIADGDCFEIIHLAYGQQLTLSQNKNQIGVYDALVARTNKEKPIALMRWKID